MIPVAIYTLAAFGIAFVVGFAKISLGIREFIAARCTWLISLLECPACLGFWIGLVAGALNLPGLFNEITPYPRLYRVCAALMLGFYTVATNFLLGRISSLIPNPQGDHPRE